MSQMKEMFKTFKKKYGPDTVAYGARLQNVERLPIDVFPFDLATGGGLPLGRVIVFYGPESSLKTTNALKAIAAFQKKYPRKVCVFIDLEGHYDPEWGSILGVDNTKLYYILPENAEQVVDIVQEILQADDIGIVVVDSLAAMITSNEVVSDGDKMIVAGAGLVINRLYRKITIELARARKAGKYPIILLINQIRFKINAGYSDPEVMPGGMAFKFASSLTVRFYGKDEVVPAINPTMPAYKICSGIIKKYKVPIFGRTFEFKMGALTSKRNNLKLGQISDWGVILRYLKEVRWVIKRGNSYVMGSDIFSSEEKLRNNLTSDETYWKQLKAALIQELLPEAIDSETRNDDDTEEEDEI